jgi:hypothetical protein
MLYRKQRLEDIDDYLLNIKVKSAPKSKALNQYKRAPIKLRSKPISSMQEPLSAINTYSIENQSLSSKGCFSSKSKDSYDALLTHRSLMSENQGYDTIASVVKKELSIKSASSTPRSEPPVRTKPFRRNANL